MEETLGIFQGVKEGYFVDCTLGFGGHSEAMLRRYPMIKLIGIDRDEEALAFAKERLSPFKDRCEFIKGSFAEVVGLLDKEPVVGVLADFGVSSLQLDKSERGFNFDAPLLDMRMDRSAPLSAYDVVNGYTKEQLTAIFRDFGEIKEAYRLAEVIVKKRASQPIKSAEELSDLVSQSIRSKKKVHPATLAFQAIRIEVNDELGQIEKLLNAIEQRHFKDEIVACITFHSLEDRIVKIRFKRWEQRCICPQGVMRCECGNNHALGMPLTKKPVAPKDAEIETNGRSRSAKLRAFRFTDEKKSS